VEADPGHKAVHRGPPPRWPGAFRLHDLRHFMATEMLAAGVPIATVSQRLSHARASTTLNVYAHAIPGGDQDAAETLAGILDAHRSDTTQPDTSE
jgi:integrase